MLLLEHKSISKLLISLSERDNYALGVWLGSKESFGKCYYMEDLAVLIIHTDNSHLLTVEADDATEDYLSFEKQDKELQKWASYPANKALSCAEDFTSAQDQYLQEWSEYWQEQERNQYEDMIAEQNSEYMSAVL
nr:MAG TPA: hypothetical protein [Caudoviricetes sp.]